MSCIRHQEKSQVDPVGMNVGVKKVGGFGRRFALLAVDAVVRGMGCRIPLGSPRYFTKNNDYTYDDFLIYQAAPQ